MWQLIDEGKDWEYYYTSNWFCEDGDFATLEINKEFETWEIFIHCFSGAADSQVAVSQIDFELIYNKIGKQMPQHFNEQAFGIADYFCSIFCKSK